MEKPIDKNITKGDEENYLEILKKQVRGLN